MTILEYNALQSPEEQKICERLMTEINSNLKFTESKLWHGHPVWFIDGNPIVGYSKLKAGVQLMFWSGADFDEPDLQPRTGRFKDASIMYTDETQVNSSDLKRWLKKSEQIQWDYKNIVKRKGELVRLK